MSRTNIWRAKLWVWLPSLLFLMLNLAALALYRAEFAGQVPALERRVKNARTELSALDADLAVMRSTRRKAIENRDQLERFYTEVLSTESERLTKVITEVKNLARRAGLKPSSYSYPSDVLEDYGLVKRSIEFAVGGDYLALRKFINLLELSDFFLTLEEIGLSGREEGVLRINLRVSTLFIKEVGESGAGVAGTDGGET